LANRGPGCENGSEGSYETNRHDRHLVGDWACVRPPRGAIRVEEDERGEDCHRGPPGGGTGEEPAHG
jgi:hypothetical protein